MICTDIAAPTYLLFSSEAPALLYYSHIPALVISLLLGIFIITRRHTPRAILLFALTMLFSVWIVFNLILWTSVDTDVIAFVWSLYGILQPLVFATALLFFSAYIYERRPNTIFLLIVLVSLLPAILFHSLNTAGFDLVYCEAYDDPESWFYYYYFVYEGFALLAFLGLGLPKLLEKGTKKQEISLLAAGLFLFLLFFAGTGLLSTYLVEHGHPDAYELEFYGLFAMTFFLGFLTYLIVRFRAFNIKLIGAQALMIGLVILVGSQIFFVESTINTVLVIITFIMSVIGGLLLVRSVKKEVQQREEIEKLAEQLKKANKRLKVLDQLKSEFVSIASHQLRSPLTSIRGYASMLLEGSFGKLTDKGKEAIERISESSRLMAMSVEDYLNVSRIEAGRMKYELSDFNLKEMAEHIVDDLRPMAIKKGLVLTSKTSEVTSRGIVHADIGKAQQIIHNLVDNALKYTPKGTVTVRVRDDKKKKRIYIDIVDSGVGMDKEAIEEVFEKFIRARNANKVNVSGTGLGLYVAKKMAEGMGGTITADSEGEGKGSVFTFELPLAM